MFYWSIHIYSLIFVSIYYLTFICIHIINSLLWKGMKNEFLFTFLFIWFIDYCAHSSVSLDSFSYFIHSENIIHSSRKHCATHSFDVCSFINLFSSFIHTIVCLSNFFGSNNFPNNNNNRSLLKSFFLI